MVIGTFGVMVWCGFEQEEISACAADEIKTAKFKQNMVIICCQGDFLL